MKTKIRAILFILLIILIHAKLCATAQVSDVIILGTENNRLLTNPLESLFFKKPELKEKYKNIRSKYDALIATNCWRGYIAKFKIVGSALYVVDVTIKISVPPADDSSHFQTKNISIFSELFETENAVFCDFYSGMLIVPQGAMVKYVHGGYLSEYEKYILIKITDGKVICKGEYRLQEYKEKKEKAFEAFYKSEKYEDCWNKIKNSFVESISEESKKEIMKETDDFYVYDFFEFED